MNRDELLTKLAMEIHPNDFDHGEPYNWYEFVFTGDEYLQRRAELINKPSWGDAPEWAQWLMQDMNGDWIDEFARTATVEEFRGAMRFTIGKYNRRMGRKDEIAQEVRKMRDYCDRWLSYEEVQ